MSVWDDVSDNVENLSQGRDLHSGYGFAPATEMPPQRTHIADRTVSITQIEESGTIVGIRIEGISDLELETNMRVEQDGTALILYDKEWAAIHDEELEIYLGK